MGTNCCLLEPRTFRALTAVAALKTQQSPEEVRHQPWHLKFLKLTSTCRVVWEEELKMGLVPTSLWLGSCNPPSSTFYLLIFYRRILSVSLG